jgi:hypothetical protein
MGHRTEMRHVAAAPYDKLLEEITFVIALLGA